MGKEIETKFSVYRLWNLCDEGVVPCQSISTPYSPSRSPTLTWGCRCRTQWEWSMLMFALGVEVTHFGCIHKVRTTIFFNPNGNLIFLSVVLMINPRTLSSEPLLPSRFILSQPFMPTAPLQRYYLHHHCDSYIYWHRHYIFYILPQV